jgi:Flp pilus assembly protein TadG
MRIRGRGTRAVDGERGSSVVEFAFVSVLLVFLLFAVLQIAALFYVRAIVSASAADGARYAANADVAPSDGGARATDLIREGLNGQVADDVPCDGSVEVDPDTGLALTSVHCHGEIHSILLPLAAFIGIDVRSRSLREAS